MRYQNCVASAIKPEVFRVPFIGKNAFTVQLAQAEEEFQKLSETMENQEKKLSDTKEILGLLSTESDVDIKYRLDVIATLRMLNKSIDKCEENIRKLKENSTLIQKQLQLDELEKMLRGLDYTISSDTEKIGGMRARILPRTGSRIAEALHVKALFCEKLKIFLLLTGHHHRTGGQPRLPLLPCQTKEIIGAPGV